MFYYANMEMKISLNIYPQYYAATNSSCSKKGNLLRSNNPCNLEQVLQLNMQQFNVRDLIIIYLTCLFKCKIYNSSFTGRSGFCASTMLWLEKNRAIYGTTAELSTIKADRF